jgi:bifunctional DNA-binding transcriptional regulator/antitoxin component of YhaV-PrlF toxin-antitoxin module
LIRANHDPTYPVGREIDKEIVDFIPQQVYHIANAVYLCNGYPEIEGTSFRRPRMSRVTEKYQVTIPPAVRTALNIMPGVDVGFEEEKGRFFLIKNPNADPVEKWRGVLRVKKTTDEIIEELRGYGIESVD